MKGVSLFPSDNQEQLIAAIDPLLFEGDFDLEKFTTFFEASDYADFTLSKDSLLVLSDEVMIACSENSDHILEKVIGEMKKSTINIDIADDKMSAMLSFVKTSDLSIPNINDIIEKVKQKGIVRGFSRKRVRNLLHAAIDAERNTEVSDIIAKGLPPRNGKDSFVKPLVPNALDRLLRPQDKENGKVDMRDLGNILCVQKNSPVAKIIPPSEGRIGITITGRKVSPIPGKWQALKLGANTAASEKNKNIVIASKTGQPKFKNGAMSIDETFTAENGVNVGTGNIKYDGAVIVKGDVTENMEIIAKGDITINGFAESAYIRSGGDIIITQGAMGKMNDEDCQLIASGSIFIQHAQGLDIVAGKNVHVSKQLAYSRVRAKGSITVGSIDKPMGTLFASTIHTCASLQAGSIGAISGSAMTIDFSDGYNLLCSRYDALVELFKQLSSNNADHEIKISNINNQHIPNALKAKLLTLNNELEAERVLLQWLRGAQEELQDRKINYELNARVVANKELFPGVTIKLNKKLWRGEREHQRCQVVFDDGKWLFEALV
jgi:uncharacterized protein (DUF342 family)